MNSLNATGRPGWRRLVKFRAPVMIAGGILDTDFDLAIISAMAPAQPEDTVAWVKPVVDRDLQTLNRDRRAAQNAVNTPDEYVRIDGACSA